MTERHTSEPWTVTEDVEHEGAWWSLRGERSDFPDETLIFDLSTNTASGESEANAARIVACVNAMEGVSDPAGFVAEHARMEDALIAIDRYEGADDYSELVHIHSLVLRTLRSIGVQEARGAAEAG